MKKVFNMEKSDDFMEDDSQEQWSISMITRSKENADSLKRSKSRKTMKI